MDDFVRLDAVIIPSPEIRDLAIKLSENLSERYKTEFTLNGKDINPHISCYATEYPVRNISLVESGLDEITSSFDSFTVRLMGLKVIKEAGRLGVEIVAEKSTDIYRLHKKIIKGLNNLRQGHIRDKYKNPKYFQGFPRSKRKIIKRVTDQTGFPRAYEIFVPHISITAFAKSVIREDISLPDFDKLDMKVTKLGLFTMGRFGTCNELIHSAELS